MTIHICRHVGVAFITDKKIKKIPSRQPEWKFKYTIRQGISIIGGLNDPENELADPFDENYHENFIEGKGYTIEAAEKVFEENLHHLTEGLWA